MFFAVLYISLCSITNAGFATAANHDPTDSASPEQIILAARRASVRGDFVQEVGLWLQLDAHYALTGDSQARADILVRLADAYQALGHNRQALVVLVQAQKMAVQGSDPRLQAAVEGSLGRLYFHAGKLDLAQTYLNRSAEIARTTGNTVLLAATLNDLGTLLGARRDHAGAEMRFQESAKHARQAGARTLVAKALTNLARVSLNAGQDAVTKALLSKAASQARALSGTHTKARLLIAAGRLWYEYYARAPALRQDAADTAQQLLREGATVVDGLGDKSTLAYALGYLGRLREAQQRNEQALALTQRAIFAAQQANADESLYLWQWQLGRLWRAQGESDAAIAAYAQAVNTLETIRPDLAASAVHTELSFQNAVGVVYFELADLLLHRAAQREDRAAQQTDLRRAQRTIEQLRSAELTDYFQDDCVAALQARTTPLDRVDPDTAVVYPILLEDRTELLLTLYDGLRQVTLPVDKKNLTKVVRLFRERLEKLNTYEYKKEAAQLYEWIVAPIEKELAGRDIDTLVFILGGPLRTIPMAALYDEKQKKHLIEKYAVATTAGMTLTDFQPIGHEPMNLLISGLTQAAQGFPALRYVDHELDKIHSIYDGGTILKDDAFTLDGLKQELRGTPYSIVHIASHGQFRGEKDEIFVLTTKGRLNLTEMRRLMSLGQYREQPVELLTLSACHTAATDERAALGLAGVAVQAGARSVLATLWFVNDQATAFLVEEFYSQLQAHPGLSKARALQRAQLMLLTKPQFLPLKHAAYWAPFLIIGNWL